MSFAFAGTPEFAAWVLRDLVELKRRPALVISQPARPKGRGRCVAAPPAALEAERLGLRCVLVESINSPEVLDLMRKAGASRLVVAAFGQILRKTLLERVLCLNVHASLLPAYRGPAPIVRALAAGEARTGVTIMRVTEPLDEGPWALRKALSLDLHDDAGSVGRVLASLGAAGMHQVLQGIDDGTVVWTEQEGEATYAPKLTAVDSFLNTDRPARAVHDQVRSLSPAIGARAASGEVTFKVWRTWPFGDAGVPPLPSCAQDAAGVPGRLGRLGQRLFIGCATGVIEILAVQPAGKRKMTAAEFLRGYQERLGDQLIAPAAGSSEPVSDSPCVEPDL